MITAFEDVKWVELLCGYEADLNGVTIGAYTFEDANGMLEDGYVGWVKSARHSVDEPADLTLDLETAKRSAYDRAVVLLETA